MRPHAPHFGKRRAHIAKRLQTKLHLHPSRPRQHRPQQQEKEPKITRELAARGGDGSVICTQHYQDGRSVCTKRNLPCDEYELLAKWAGNIASCPSVGADAFVGRHRLIPQ